MNPLEAMIDGQSPQVANRWFSPLMAWDAAEQIWAEVVKPSDQQVIQVGVPECWSRYEIAKLVNPEVQPCKHEDFPGIAPRPINTTYKDSRWNEPLALGIDWAKLAAWNDRAIELALFFGGRVEDAAWKLEQGFGSLHNAVSDDWRKRNPQTEAEMLAFYRETNCYIWELSAYHQDPGWNYQGICDGIAVRLKNEPGCKSVLCLGDGIGDLTLALHRAGFDARYHDLEGSRTAAYAAFRFWRQTGEHMSSLTTSTFTPFLVGTFDAIVSLDFLEHVSNVEDWVREIHRALRPGGLFCAQNAFACGSGPDGAMPMHLSCNDRWEKDWDPLLTEIGFEQLGPQWYRRKL
jgi:2-polyprenyl-3-methyl-5-hydroxy-6-metoxy-1,4-benzoquinol methylase